MCDIITKYFRNTKDNEHVFNEPATDNQIEILETQLGIILPDDYKDFLKFTNGFDGFINDFFATFDSVDNIYKKTQDYCSKYFPWAIFIGTNGNSEMFVIDKRHTPYQFGLLPFVADENDFISLGITFEKFISRLYNDTAFKSQ